MAKTGRSGDRVYYVLHRPNTDPRKPWVVGWVRRARDVAETVRFSTDGRTTRAAMFDAEWKAEAFLDDLLAGNIADRS